MRLVGIDPGDIVLVDIKGRRFHAIVMDRQSGSLRVQPIDTRISYWNATSRQVLEAWRKAGKRARSTSDADV